MFSSKDVKSLKAHERLAERLANIITRLNRGEHLDPYELTLDFSVSKKLYNEI